MLRHEEVIRVHQYYRPRVGSRRKFYRREHCLFQSSHNRVLGTFPRITRREAFLRHGKEFREENMEHLMERNFSELRIRWCIPCIPFRGQTYVRSTSIHVASRVCVYVFYVFVENIDGIVREAECPLPFGDVSLKYAKMFCGGAHTHEYRHACSAASNRPMGSRTTRPWWKTR